MKETFDSLTGLWNFDTVTAYLTDKISSGTAFSIALCDIDFFINIDSKVGSPEGDQILIRMAEFFSSFNEFKVGRYCSDSFILTFESLDKEQVIPFVDALRKQFRKQRFMDQESIYAKVPITVSFGIVFCSGEGCIEQLLKLAEIALAEAKKKGRNRVISSVNDEIQIITDNRSGVSTLIGGLVGYSGDGSDAKNAQIAEPYGLDITANGELLIADRGNHAIRLVDHKGIIKTIAGDGSYGYSGDGGYATKTRFNKPSGVAVGVDGCIYIADTGNHCIKKINAQGIIETLAGCGSEGYEGDGMLGNQAKFSRPGGVVVDMHNNVYTNDYGNNVIRVIKNDGFVYTLAGSGEFGYDGDGGDPLKASIDKPYGLAVTKNGQYIYIADYGNHCIREVDVAADRIKTICGTGEPGYSGDGGDGQKAQLNGPFWICVWNEKYLLIADAENHCIRILSLKTNMINTLTGNGKSGYVDLTVHDGSAKYNIPAGMAVDYMSNYLYIADYANNAIRVCNLNSIQF
ncbi:MAG: diguanylate cyclase [Clostridiales bacterium]|nr:diguanylate cyclase [Clostridiales bacterium]